MTYAFSLVPLLLMLAVLKFTDSFTFAKWKHIALCFAAGVAVCLSAIAVARLLAARDIPFYSPLIEETLKCLLLLVLVCRKRVVFVQQALCYGAALGAGFAFAENIAYINVFSTMSAGTSLFRGLGTAVMHMSCPMIAATFLTTSAMLFDEGERAKGTVIGLAGLASAVALHGLFNLMLLPMWMQLALTLLVFVALVGIISAYNERRICRWLDQSIINDIGLLSAIREGKMLQSRQGQYLLTVKSQFEPEVVADMFCYIRLYLEMVIEDKSRLMLREAGLETPRTPQEKALRCEMLCEFRALRRRIGKAGESVLRPIIRLSRDDAALIGD